MSLPSNITDPEDGSSRVPIIFKSVLFPDPEGPVTAMESPRSTVKLILLSTVLSLLPDGDLNIFLALKMADETIDILNKN